MYYDWKRDRKRETDRREKIYRKLWIDREQKRDRYTEGEAGRERFGDRERAKKKCRNNPQTHVN